MRIPIAPKIGLFASVVIIVVGWTVSHYAIESARSLLIEHEQTDLRDETKLQVELLSNHIATMREDVLQLAGMPTVRESLRTRSTTSRNKLQTILKHICVDHGTRKPYYQVRLIGRDGREIVRVERKRIAAGGEFEFSEAKLDDLDKDLKYDQSKRPYVNQTLALGPQQVYLSEVELNREGGVIEEPFMPVMRASVPIYLDDTGQAEGLVIINLDMGELEELVVSPRHRFYLTNQEGHFLIHPESEKEFAWELAKDPEQRVRRGINEDWRSVIQDEAVFAELKPYFPADDSDPGSGTPVRSLSQNGHLFSELLQLQEPFILLRLKIATPDRGDVEKWRSTLAAALSELREAYPRVTQPKQFNPTATSIVFGAPLTPEGRRDLRAMEAKLQGELGKKSISRQYLQECTSFVAYFFRLQFDPRHPDRHLGLVMAFSIDELQADLKDAVGWIRAFVVMCIAVGVCLAFLFSHTLTRPLIQTTRAAERIAAGDFDVTLPLGKRDEIGDLARSFESMMNEIDARSAQIRVREARLRMIFNTAAEGIITLDEEGKVQSINWAAERMFGCVGQSVMGEHARSFMVEDFHGMLDSFLASSAGIEDSCPPSVSVETRGVRHDGSEFPLQLSMSSVLVEKQRIFTLIMHDITERRQHEQRLREWSEELEQSVNDRTAELQHTNAELQIERNRAQELNTAKDAFLASVSHELRNPLNQVTGFCQLLEFTELDNGQRGDLKKIRLAADQLLDLINDILDYQKIILGGMKLEPENFDLAQLLTQVRDGMAIQANENENELVFEWSDDLGELYAEERRVRQVLLNLIGNACKFTQKGTVTVSAVRRVDSGNEWFEVSIVDTGRGMTHDEQQKLFTPFTKLSSKQGNRTGTGLGLVICEGLCQLMRGHIEVKSVFEQGTTFTVRLPATASDHLTSNDANPAASARPIAPAARIEAPTLTGSVAVRVEQQVKEALGDNSGPTRTVLVIDDDAGVREMIQRHLSGRGFRVVTASSGIQGLELAKRIQPAAITLDALMPGLDGWGVLGALKADEQTASIPVVMVSITDNEQKAQSLGATEYLHKPIDWEQLSSTLAQYTGDKRDRTILVVDDEQTTREILRRSLEHDGWRVTEACNGKEALEILAEERPAGVILDLMMPVMDGFEFIAEYSQLGEWFSVPILVLSAKDPTPAERELLEGGVVRVLRKGQYTQDELLEELHRRVDVHIRSESIASEGE